MKNNKEKVLLIVNTEMGLLLALLYFFENLRNKYIPHFIVLKKNSQRFENLNLTLLPGEFNVFEDQLNSRVLKPSITFKQILNEQNVKEILYQNPLNFMTNAIVNKYKANDSAIVLTVLSDGLVFSAGIRKKYVIILNIILLYRKFVNRIDHLPLRIKQYADVVENIDILIAGHNIGAKHYISTNSLLAEIEKYGSEIHKVFNIDLQLFKQSKLVFFTQPISIYSHKEITAYYATLTTLVNYVVDEKINMIIKVHPADKVENYIKYQGLYVAIDEKKNVPSEIIMNYMHNKIFISMFSSTSINNVNKSIKHVWLYKVMNFTAMKITNPGHIYVPIDYVELKSTLKQLLAGVSGK